MSHYCCCALSFRLDLLSFLFLSYVYFACFSYFLFLPYHPSCLQILHSLFCPLCLALLLPIIVFSSLQFTCPLPFFLFPILQFLFDILPFFSLLFFSPILFSFLFLLCLVTATCLFPFSRFIIVSPTCLDHLACLACCYFYPYCFFRFLPSPILSASYYPFIALARAVAHSYL